MRLKITFEKENLKLPMNYQNILQGLTYTIFDKDEYGDFLHNQGYREGKRVFKMFTFSNLFGKYKIENDFFIFDKYVHFYIGSHSEQFIKLIYDFFNRNEFISLYFQIVKVIHLEIIDIPYFRGVQTKKIKTISPVVAYRTKDKYFEYFKPSDDEFNEICYKNLIDKNKALEEPIRDLNFKINEIIHERKRVVRFKNTFYIAYLTEMLISVDYDTLMLIYNTGLSSKGPAGFGMIDVV